MKSKTMQKLFSLLLSLLIALPMLFLAGCQGNPSGDGEDDDDIGFEFKTWEYVQGFRAAIRPTDPGKIAIENQNEYGFFLFDKLTDAILNNMLASYGIGGSTTNFIGKSTDNEEDYIYPSSSILGTDSERSFLNYDAIRHTAEVAPISNYFKFSYYQNTSWNWTLHYGKDKSPNSITSLFSHIGGEDYYVENSNFSSFNTQVSNYYKNGIDTYTSAYQELYTRPLTINIFEVLLNLPPTTFTPVYYANNNYANSVAAHEGDETWLSMQVAGSPATSPFSPQQYHSGSDPFNPITARLNWLKSEYIRSTSYLGVQWQESEHFNGSGTPQSDGGRIVQYILNNIVGSARVSADSYNLANEYYNSYVPKYYYRDTITHIVKELLKSETISQNYDGRYDTTTLSFNPGDTAGAFFPVAGIEYTDYRLNDFMVPEVGDNDFVNSPSQEYQSLLILPKKDMVFQSSILLFQSLTHDMTINVRMRWYNHSTNQTTMQDVGLMHLTRGAYHWEDNDNSILVEPPYDAVANMNTSNITQNLAINSPPKALERKTSSQYYKTINSANGFGTVAVTNEAAVNFSFFEFVFDVVKNPNDPVGTRYDFQVVMIMFAVDALAS